jgi:uncharacterized protein (TIRG00374 family)
MGAASHATVEPVSRPRRRHVLHAIALVVGLVGLAILIDQVGWTGITDSITDTGRWFLVIAAIDLASLCCDAAGVYCFVRPLAPISYPRVLVAQASGLAINRLTPGNSLGEPIKITMLMEHVPETAAVSAIVLFNVASYVVAMSAIVIGVPLTLLALDLPSHVQITILVVTCLIVLAIAGLIVLARRGAVATPINALRRLRLISAARADRWKQRIAAIDTNVRTFGDGATRRALVFTIASRLLNMAGTVVILIAAGTELTVPLAIGIPSVGIVITWLSNVIPLGLGLADGSNYLLYGALGSSSESGLYFTMVNRVRTVLLASMGLTIMAIANLFDRRADTTRT